MTREWGLPRGGIAAADLFLLTSDAVTREIYLARAMSCATTAAAATLECRRRNGRKESYSANGARRATDPGSRGGSTSALAHLCGHNRRHGCIFPARDGHAAAASTPCCHAVTLLSLELSTNMNELEGAARRLGPSTTGMGELVKFEGTARCLGPLGWMLMEEARAKEARAATRGRLLDLVIMLITYHAAPMRSDTTWSAPMGTLDAVLPRRARAVGIPTLAWEHIRQGRRAVDSLRDLTVKPTTT